MRCRIFSIPLDSEGVIEQERRLNTFLDKAEVKRVFASLASPSDGPVWSVLFLYDDGDQTVEKSPESRLSTGVSHPRSSTSSAGSGSGLSREEAKSIIALKRWRADAAEVEGVPVYMVAQNKWLEDIVRIPVKTVDDLKKVEGFGDWRVQKYGSKIVEVMRSASHGKRAFGSSSYSGGRA